MTIEELASEVLADEHGDWLREAVAFLADALLQKKRLGRHARGRVPYGYTSTGGILEPAEELIPIVERIYRDACDGLDAGPDRTSAQPRRPPSAQGGVWKPQVVRSILMNPAYAGERCGVRNAHTPIVSRRACNAAQAALAARARAS
jgi:hypothetical protein